MIKKNTKAIFNGGNFKGEYNWKGGIPLSEGEDMQIKKNGEKLLYHVKHKNVVCTSDGEDQIIDVIYELEYMGVLR